MPSPLIHPYTLVSGNTFSMEPSLIFPFISSLCTFKLNKCLFLHSYIYIYICKYIYILIFKHSTCMLICLGLFTFKKHVFKLTQFRYRAFLSCKWVPPYNSPPSIFSWITESPLDYGSGVFSHSPCLHSCPSAVNSLQSGPIEKTGVITLCL